jgi:hypothetical protein
MTLSPACQTGNTGLKKCAHILNLENINLSNAKKTSKNIDTYNLQCVRHTLSWKYNGSG